MEYGLFWSCRLFIFENGDPGRLGRFCKFQIVEVPDEKAPESLSQAEMDEVMAKEGERILAKIKDREYVYALAIKGKERSSEEFAKEINQ